jgi:hypothetical protein
LEVWRSVVPFHGGGVDARKKVELVEGVGNTFVTLQDFSPAEKLFSALAGALQDVRFKVLRVG